MYHCFRMSGFIMAQDRVIELEGIGDAEYDEFYLALVFTDDLELTSAPIFEESP